MKHPGLQHQERLREFADFIAQRSCALRAAREEDRNAERIWRTAHDAVARAEVALTAAIGGMASLATAAQIDEDGRAVPQSTAAPADKPA